MRLLESTVIQLCSIIRCSKHRYLKCSKYSYSSALNWQDHSNKIDKIIENMKNRRYNDVRHIEKHRFGTFIQ